MNHNFNYLFLPEWLDQAGVYSNFVAAENSLNASHPVRKRWRGANNSPVYLALYFTGSVLQFKLKGFGNKLWFYLYEEIKKHSAQEE